MTLKKRRTKNKTKNKLKIELKTNPIFPELAQTFQGTQKKANGGPEGINTPS